MAKEKAKHDGLLCFLLALIVVLILVIGGGAYYFLVVDNGEKIAEKAEKPEQSTNVENNNAETIKLSQTELNEIKNYMIQNDMEYFLIETYEDVRKAILDEGILYPFICKNGEQLKDKELIELYGSVPETGENFKIAKSKVENFLKKNTGYSLEEFKYGKNLGKSIYNRIQYSEEDDLYYMSTAGALMPISGELISAEKNGNQYILNYEITTLILNKVGDKYLIVSHMKKNTLAELYAGEDFYVQKDYTILYSNLNSGYILDEDGNKLVAKQVFTQNYWQDDELKNAGICNRMLIITKDNRLMYLDDPYRNKSYVAKLLSDELVSKLEIEKVKIDNDEERIDLIIKTKSGKEILKKGINDRYYFDSTKQIDL